MATIVEHIKTGERSLLVGSGFATFQSAVPGFLGAPNYKEGTSEVVLVCDADGGLKWVASSALRVVSVDGETPERALMPQDSVRADEGEA